MVKSYLLISCCMLCTLSICVKSNGIALNRYNTNYDQSQHTDTISVVFIGKLVECIKCVEQVKIIISCLESKLSSFVIKPTALVDCEREKEAKLFADRSYWIHPFRKMNKNDRQHLRVDSDTRLIVLKNNAIQIKYKSDELLDIQCDSLVAILE
jgi:hypothetical protein